MDDDEDDTETGVVEPGQATDEQSTDDGFSAAVMEDVGFDVNAVAGDPGDDTTDGTPGEPSGSEEEAPGGTETEPGEEQPGEEATKAEPSDEEKEETDQEKGAKLTPEVQQAVDRRIGKEVAKRKDAEEALESERAHSRSLQEEVKTLQAQVVEGETASAAGSGIYPLFLAEDETAIEKREARLWEVERWCTKNQGGYLGTDNEKDPSYDSEEILERLIQVREERERLIPRARALLQQRRGFDDMANETYPDLANPASADYREARDILRKNPAIRARPDALLFVGDLIAGRKIREAKKPGEGAPPKKAPRVPTRTTAGNRSTGSQKPTPKTKQWGADGDFSDDSLASHFDS